MVYKRYIFLFIITTLCTILASCNNELKIKDTYNKENKIHSRTVTIDKTDFLFFNYGKLSEDKLNKITEELHEAYDQILEFKKEDYQWPHLIEINLYAQNALSTAYYDIINLYYTHTDDYPLEHELVHILIGIGEPNDFHNMFKNGIFIEEGLAVYLQEKIKPNRKIPPNYNVPTHTIMRHLLDNNRVSSLEEMLNPSNVEYYYNTDDNQRKWEFYVQAGSFVTYLLNQYSKDQLLEIYNTPNIQEKVSEVYGKDIATLEQEWHAYILSNIEPPSFEEKVKIMFP